MTNLTIAFIQLDTIWENIDVNLQKVEAIVNQQTVDFDILILPEMFATGFSMNVNSCAQTMDGSIVNWMKLKSEQWNCAILGSVAIEEEGIYYNRLLMAHGNNLQFYDKHHLFTMGEEPLYYTAGMQATLFNYKGLVMKPAVCYDLRFPVWLRNTNDYDILICVANWPKPRIDVWDTLLKARALENQTFVVGVNRSGQGDGLHYNGHSMLIDAKGKVLAKLNEETDGFARISIDLDKQNDFRNKFPVLNDSDIFIIKN